MTAEKPRPQIDKFKEAARELETDDREATFNGALKKVAKSEKRPSAPAKPSVED